MDKTANKNGLWPLLSALCGALMAAAFWKLNGISALGVLGVCSVWLRTLSLSGTVGNLTAWALVVSISMLPALGLIRRERQRADWLLLLASLELFTGLYFLVNPTLIFPMELAELEHLAQGWGLVAGGCVLSTLVVWGLLRLLRELEQSPARLLPRILFWTAVLYGSFAGMITTWRTISVMEDVAASNTDHNRVLTSGVILVVLAVIELIPPLLGTWVLLWGGTLAETLDQAPFAEETVELAETIARQCALVARLSLTMAVGCNLLRLLSVPWTAWTSITVYLPLVTLALCAALALLCQYFRRAKAVSDDNNSII